MFRVTVSKDYLGFSAAHFITFRGHACESLHGHNYRVAVTVQGPIDPECHFVLDFADLKRAVRPLVDRLDHCVLLPEASSKLGYRHADGMTYVSYLGTPTYQFPSAGCVLLPIANTTAELLAQWLGDQLVTTLRGDRSSIEWIEVEVEETPGQSAQYRAIIIPA